MNANDIVRLLKSKNSDDIFVLECKSGPTHYAHHFRLDAWSMKKSWANFCCTGYEVKVNRSDFINDGKWINYLDMCNEFYFVTPSGLVKKEEVPEQAGLMWVAKTGTRLFTKKKAPYRDIEPPWMVMAYVLMKYGPTGAFDENAKRKLCDKERTRKYWKQWLEDKKIDYDLGYNVRGELARRLVENQRSLERDNERLSIENKKLEEYKELARIAGLSWRGRDGKLDELKKLADVINKVNDGRTVKEIARIRDELDNALAVLGEGSK